MDHIPSPADPYRPIAVPYYNGENYDGLGFFGFPARKNWDIKKVIDTSLDLSTRRYLEIKTLGEAVSYLEKLLAASSSTRRDLWGDNLIEHIQFLHQISKDMAGTTEWLRERTDTALKRYGDMNPLEWGLTASEVSTLEGFMSAIRTTPVPTAQTLGNAISFFRWIVFPVETRDAEGERKFQYVEAFLTKLSAIVPHEAGWLVPHGSGWRITYGDGHDQITPEVDEPLEDNLEPSASDHASTHLPDIPDVDPSLFELDLDEEERKEWEDEQTDWKLHGRDRRLVLKTYFEELQAAFAVPPISQINNGEKGKGLEEEISTPLSSSTEGSETDLERAIAMSLETPREGSEREGDCGNTISKLCAKPNEDFRQEDLDKDISTSLSENSQEGSTGSTKLNKGKQRDTGIVEEPASPFAQEDIEEVFNTGLRSILAGLERPNHGQLVWDGIGNSGASKDAETVIVGNSHIGELFTPTKDPSAGGGHCAVQAPKNQQPCSPDNSVNPSLSEPLEIVPPDSSLDSGPFSISEISKWIVEETPEQQSPMYPPPTNFGECIDPKQQAQRRYKLAKEIALDFKNLSQPNPSEVFLQPHIGPDDELATVVRVLQKNRPAFFGDIKNQNGKLKRDALAFLQSWLFFGTLCEVFKVASVTIDTSRYIRRLDNGQQLITTKNLPYDLERWRERESCVSEGIKLQHSRRIEAIIRHANQLAANLEEPHCLFHGSEVTLSIMALCLTLHRTLFQVYDCVVSPIGGKSKYLASRFKEGGWCPNLTTWITASWPILLQYYAYLLGPPLVSKNHQECTKGLCVSNQVDIQHYETKHQHHCECERLRKRSHYRNTHNPAMPSGFSEAVFETDLQKTISILESGGIPLVSVSNPMLEKYDTQPDIVEFKPGMRYVAISHVWADGMGNPNRNCLPLCQLLALRAKIAPLLLLHQLDQERLHFWIDTLCVPVSPKSARKSAIIAMQQTYQQADSVLVLDAELMQRDIPASSLECIARVLTSNWQRRLWTFQEAALAKNIFFQFHNRCTEGYLFLLGEGLGLHEVAGKSGFSLRDLFSKTSIERQMFTELNTPWFPGFKMESQLSLPKGLMKSFDRFTTSWSGISWRSTSKQSDETVCVASLLELDLRQLLDTPEPQRMKKLLSLQRMFPPSMIFIPCPRIPEPGYGWAPSSFLSKLPDGHRQDMFGKHVPLTENGLLVEFPGLVFPANRHQISPDIKSYTFHVKHERQQSSAPLPQNTYRSPHMYGILLDTEGGSLQEDWSTHPPDSLALICKYDLQRSTGSIQPINKAALVSIYREDEGVLFVRFICVATILQDPTERPLTSSFTKPILREFRANERLDSADFTKLNQRWCIG